MPLWRALEGAGGYRLFDVVAHRRWGKDDVALHYTATQAMQRPGMYWHMLPEASQARKAIWDAVNPHTGQKRIDEAFPKELRRATRNNDMFMELQGGSTWQVVGSDNYDSLVGSSPAGIVFSEWSLARPEAWSFFQPILEENGGWGLFLWTPRGRNHATRAFESREQNPARWYTLRSPATITDVFTPGQLDEARAELIAELGSEEEGEAKYRQEYLVDFDAAVPGSYFGRGMSDAQAQGRIGKFPYDPSLPVHTAWDIGVHDYTALWFLQENGQDVRAIEYYEASGEGAEQVVRAALPELIPDPDQRAEALARLGNMRPQPYTYGRHHLPHDVMVREWGGGAKSRYETLKGLGLKNISVGVAQDPEERINASRRLMPVVSFDAVRCAVGIDRLRNYRRRWNSSTLVYTGPLHDENSHGADAFGEFAVNKRVKPQPEAPKPKPKPRYQKPKREVSGWTGL